MKNYEIVKSLFPNNFSLGVPKLTFMTTFGELPLIDPTFIV